MNAALKDDIVDIGDIVDIVVAFVLEFELVVDVLIHVVAVVVV